MEKNWVAVMVIGFLGLALIGNFFYAAIVYEGVAFSPIDNNNNNNNNSMLFLLFGIFLVAVFLIGVFFQRDWERKNNRKRRRR